MWPEGTPLDRLQLGGSIRAAADQQILDMRAYAHQMGQFGDEAKKLEEAMKQVAETMRVTVGQVAEWVNGLPEWAEQPDDDLSDFGNE